MVVTGRINPGRGLDILIAVKVMGWKCFSPVGSDQFELIPPNGRVNDTKKGLPHYSMDIADAWEVVDKFSDYYLTIEKTPGYHDYSTQCEFGDYGKAFGKTLPHAICLAALKVMGVSKYEQEIL